MLHSTHNKIASDDNGIRLNSHAAPVDVPAGYTGPAWLPGTGRMIWWTGRVAIGLRHTPQKSADEISTVSSDWIQSVLLN